MAGHQVCMEAMLAPLVGVHPVAVGTHPRYMQEGGALKALGAWQVWGVTGVDLLPPLLAGGTPLHPWEATGEMVGMDMHAA